MQPANTLRIAMVTETYPPEVNGVARTVHMMVEGLRERGHAVQLIRPRQGEADRCANAGSYEELLCPGIPIPRYSQLRMGMPSGQALLRAWSLKRPDIVHIATEGPLGWSALAAARKLRLPTATDFHTNFHAYSRHYGFAWLSRPVAAYLRRFHNGADATLVPTDEMATGLGQLGFERLRIVGRGVNPQVFTPARRREDLRASWGAGPGTMVAMCVSRFAPEKNFPLLIEAYERMREVRPDSRLVLVGDGPLVDELRRKNVGYVIAGRKVNGELSAHYASADMFLFPSMTETFGNVTLEAMASGLAIVAYDYAAARQYLRHGESARLVPFGDRDAYIAEAAGLARNFGEVRRLGAKARRLAEGLSWDAIVVDFESALFAVLADSLLRRAEAA
ncbi:MAG: glycosyltransferase family 1 protein [Proteobacteria bacterium]|nr:glycosyltransferase family 1 protein [Pseudomonadota bacterium]